MNREDGWRRSLILSVGGLESKPLVIVVDSDLARS
jgi:hypothetical protein